MTDNTLQLVSIVAIVAGPMLALASQRILDAMRERRKRKHAVFRDLLISRGTPISLQHVQALNAIELEFYPREGKYKKVIDAWRVYIGHLNQPKIPVEEVARIQAWNDRRQELIVDLLYEMSQSLGYDLGKDMLKRDAYYPDALAIMENEQTALRKAVLQVFEGKQPIKIKDDTTR
jgi:hypothetical protein